MKRFVRFAANVILPCLLVIGPLAYAQITETQQEYYWGIIVWAADTATADGEELIDEYGNVHAVEAVSDTYGNWYNYIIGSASLTSQTTLIRTRAMNIAGFPKVSVQTYYTFANSADVDDVTQDMMKTTGKAAGGFMLYGSSYPASRINSVSPTIAQALPIGPYIAGATIAVASSPAGLSNTYTQTALLEHHPLRAPADPEMWNGLYSYDASGCASLVLEVSPLASAISGNPTMVIMVRATR